MGQGPPVPSPVLQARFPLCGKKMFLVLAAVGNAEVLVTGDKSLLQLAGRTRFAIETPARFKSRFS